MTDTSKEQDAMAYADQPLSRRIGLWAAALIGAALITGTLTWCTGLIGFLCMDEPGILCKSVAYCAAIVVNRGSFPYLQLFFFWFALLLLICQYQRRKNEQKRLSLVRSHWQATRETLMNGAQTIAGNLSDSLLATVNAFPRVLHTSRAWRRLYIAVHRFNHTRKAKGCDAVLTTLSNIDAAAIKSFYSFFRYFIWLILTLGAMGTVMASKSGIAKLGNIIEKAESWTIVKEKIPQVTHDLGSAFDSTLLALFLSAVLFAAMSYLQKRDEDLLAQLDTFSLEDVTGNLPDHDN